MPNETTIQAGCTMARTSLNPPERRIANVDQETCTDHAAEYCSEFVDSPDAEDLAFCLTTDETKAKFAALKGGGRPAVPPAAPRPVARTVAQVMNELAGIDGVQLTGTDIGTVTGEDRGKLGPLLAQLATVDTAGVDPTVRARITTFLGKSTNTGDLAPAFATARTHWGVAGPTAPLVPDDPTPAPTGGWDRMVRVYLNYNLGFPIAGMAVFDGEATGDLEKREFVLNPGGRSSPVKFGLRHSLTLGVQGLVIKSPDVAVLLGGQLTGLLPATRHEMVFPEGTPDKTEQVMLADSGEASWEESGLQIEIALTVVVLDGHLEFRITTGVGPFWRTGSGNPLHGGRIGHDTVTGFRTDTDFNVVTAAFSQALAVIGRLTVPMGESTRYFWRPGLGLQISGLETITPDQKEGIDTLTTQDNEFRVELLFDLLNFDFGI